ncbi:MAG: DUF4838 domain-containing protein [Clostridia bacterium]|nr:DUF4838 domain-containing protein [Clostridia bacterium]
MKSLLSALLALLMLLPLLVSCGGTPSPEDGSSEPVSSFHEDLTETEPISTGEKDPFEGADALPADLQVPECVKNAEGTVIGTIVLPPAATSDTVLSFAAEELRYHIEKVTGASLPIVERTGEGYGSIVLATPDTLPFIAEQFADDIAWLADLGSVESGSRYGSDGFAIRKLGDSIYVFGNTSRGAMNGVYDLIEENLGVLWIRADENKGLVYNPLEEAVLSQVDYREKSPFEYRGWVLCGPHLDTTTELMLSRNKMNVPAGDPPASVESFGCLRWSVTHNLKSLVRYSPVYDESYTGYWNTDAEGNPLTFETSGQVNFYDQKTAEAVAARAVQLIQEENRSYFFIGEEDAGTGYQIPEATLPFEYAPGCFSDPSDPVYRSDVYYSFINRVAALIRESCPDCTVMTYAYLLGIRPPHFDLEDNITLVFTPMGESMGVSLMDPESKSKAKNFLGITNHTYGEYLTGWIEVSKRVVVYNYYGCSRASAYFERPIWYRIQQDLQDYVSLGIFGMIPEGESDAMGGSSGWSPDRENPYDIAWELNSLTYWIYSKLCWNPYEDIPSLIAKYCDRVYKDASEDMQEYYRVYLRGWNEGLEKYDVSLHHDVKAKNYYRVYIYRSGNKEELLSALRSAYEKADTIRKEWIDYRISMIEQYVPAE